MDLKTLDDGIIEMNVKEHCECEGCKGTSDDFEKHKKKNLKCLNQ